MFPVDQRCPCGARTGGRHNGLRAAFPVSVFLRVELCWTRAGLQEAALGRRARVGLGWTPPGPLGPAPPPDLLITRAKNIFDLKTRGVLAV